MTNETELFPRKIYVCDNSDENVPCDFIADHTNMFRGNNVEYIRADLAVPEGHAIVPLEPTERMISSGVKSDDLQTGRQRCAHIYKAMIAAAQKGGV